MVDFKNGAVIKLSKTKNFVHEDVVRPLFISDEEFIGEYQAIRDYVIFTNKRNISVNVQGLTGKKKDFTTLPYSKIQEFSVETSGVLDLDSELELYFSGLGKVKFEFTSGSDIVTLGKLISEQVFRTPLAEQLHGPVEQVAGRSNRVLPEYALVLPRPERIIVGIGVIHRGNELIAEAQRDGRVLVHRPVELGGRVQQLVIHQLQNGERVKAARR